MHLTDVVEGSFCFMGLLSSLWRLHLYKSLIYVLYISTHLSLVLFAGILQVLEDLPVATPLHFATGLMPAIPFLDEYCRSDGCKIYG